MHHTEDTYKKDVITIGTKSYGDNVNLLITYDYWSSIHIIIMCRLF